MVETMSESSFICARCKTSFISKSILKRHEKTAKYCIPKEKIGLKCRYCNYESFRKEQIKNHESTCRKKDGVLGNGKIVELKDEIQKLIHISLRLKP